MWVWDWHAGGVGLKQHAHTSMSYLLGLVQVSVELLLVAVQGTLQHCTFMVQHRGM